MELARGVGFGVRVRGMVTEPLSLFPKIDKPKFLA